MQLTKNVKLVFTSIFILNLAVLYWSSQYFGFAKSLNLVKGIKNNFIQDDATREDILEDSNEYEDAKIESVSDIIEPKRLDGSLRLSDKCEKVIVVTTINDPTSDLAYMRDALYGWCILVVFDKKTPQNWSYKDAFVLRYIYFLIKKCRVLLIICPYGQVINKTTQIKFEKFLGTKIYF